MRLLVRDLAVDLPRSRLLTYLSLFFYSFILLLQVRNPMQNLDSFWREYTAFEQTSNSNKELGRGLISENQPKNIDARAEFRARRSRREGLTLSALPLPPSRGRAKESSQAQQWRRFIAHEITNPHTLPESDLKGRVEHAFETALSPLYRYPDVWIEYLSYVYSSFIKDGQPQTSKSGGKEGSSIAREEQTKRAAAILEPLLEKAIKALPDCVGLHAHVNWLYVRLGSPSKGVAALDTLCKKHPSALAYIQLMRASRKADGRDTARKVFGRARKDPRANDPAVYVAAAHMEFTVNKDNKVARNVFEFGLKHNAKNAIMVMEYVNWLWGLGDLEYARVVLRKVMPDVSGSPKNVLRLWERWLELEEIIGDAASVDAVELMWKEAGKTSTLVQDVLRRSRFLSFEGLAEDEVPVADGGRTSTAEKNNGSSNASAGKRDPRTGRRVPSSGGNGSGGQGNARRSGNGPVQSTPFKTAIEWLQRLAATLPHVAAQAPAPDVLLRMIADTPDKFSDTPAGRRTAASAVSRNVPISEAIVGKKRKADDIIVSQAAGLEIAAGAVVAPAHDVFRARQAAKQSRLR